MVYPSPLFPLHRVPGEMHERQEEIKSKKKRKKYDRKDTHAHTERERERMSKQKAFVLQLRRRLLLFKMDLLNDRDRLPRLPFFVGPAA